MFLLVCFMPLSSYSLCPSWYVLLSNGTREKNRMSPYGIAVRISPNMTAYVAAVFEILESHLALSPTAVIVNIPWHVCTLSIYRDCEDNTLLNLTQSKSNYYFTLVRYVIFRSLEEEPIKLQSTLLLKILAERIGKVPKCILGHSKIDIGSLPSQDKMLP